MISFDDTEIAFRSKSKSELRKAYYLFKLIGKPLLSRLGGQIANMAIKMHIPITGFDKKNDFSAILWW